MQTLITSLNRFLLLSSLQAVVPKYFILRLIRWLLVSFVVIARLALLLVVSICIFIVHTLCILIPIPAIRRGIARGIDVLGYRLLLFILGSA